MRQTALAQLSLDGADRLVEMLTERRAPLPLADAARCLFALRQAPSALVRQLVDEVIRSDPRLVWRSAGEVALTAWEELTSLTDLALEDAPFVVFDLETTGTRPGSSRIVEIGAVRMLGFEPVASFERMVNPGFPVPETITRITGIQTRDVRRAARIERVLPEFIRFAEGAVLVAHNARFDVGFVDADLARLHGRRLAAPVIDTVMLARRLLAGRVARMNLGTLAERFDTRVRPCHRALPDAEATAEILAILLGMAQEHGVRTVADAVAFSAPMRRPARARRNLARDVPSGPGVYLFRDAREQVLYVGKATDLRARVRSYFSGPAQRRPVEHALAATERIEARPLGSELEAALVELELIQRLRPPANSRGAHPERCCYLTLTVSEPVPRLSVTKEPAPGELSAGPFRSRGEAQAAAQAVRSAYGLRTCRPARPTDDGSCLTGLLGSCHAPCHGGAAAERYATAVEGARAWLEHGEGNIRWRRSASGCARSVRLSATRRRPPPVTASTRSIAPSARWPGCGGSPPAAGCCWRRTPTIASCRRSPAPAAGWSPAAGCRGRATACSRSRRWCSPSRPGRWVGRGPSCRWRRTRGGWWRRPSPAPASASGRSRPQAVTWPPPSHSGAAR